MSKRYFVRIDDRNDRGMANGFQSFDGRLCVCHFVRLRSERRVELKDGHVLAIALERRQAGQQTELNEIKLNQTKIKIKTVSLTLILPLNRTKSDSLSKLVTFLSIS